jgi:hypothetical protein
MVVDEPEAIGPHPTGLERSGRRHAAVFLSRDAKPKAAEKSRQRPLRK